MEKINVREIIDFYYPKDDELKKIEEEEKIMNNAGLEEGDD